MAKIKLFKSIPRKIVILSLFIYLALCYFIYKPTMNDFLVSAIFYLLIAWIVVTFTNFRKAKLMKYFNVMITISLFYNVIFLILGQIEMEIISMALAALEQGVIGVIVAYFNGVKK